MAKKIDFNDICFGIKGIGRVNENCPIDLREYALSSADEKNGIPVTILPQKIVVSKKIGRAVYDVTANFDIVGKRSILEQFKELILSHN